MGVPPPAGGLPPGLGGDLLPFGPAFAPWSESEPERATAFRSFMGDKFGAGTPSFLQRPVEAKFDPYQSAYLFQRGLGGIPADRTFGDYLSNPSMRTGAPTAGTGQSWLQGLVGQGANLFNQSGGTGSNLTDAFRQFLSDNQGAQFDLTKAAATTGMPSFLTPSLDKFAQQGFDKWLTGLPQGTAAMGQPANQLNWLNQFQRSGFKF